MECPASATDDSGSADGVGAWCVDAAVMEHAARPLKPAPQPEPVGWLDAPHAVFRANPNWQWQKGPTTLSASIPVWLHPTPEADERERCAAICESIAHQYKRNGHGFAAERSANAIRAQQPPRQPLSDERIDAIPFMFNLAFGEADGQDEEEMAVALRKFARAVLEAQDQKI